MSGQASSSQSASLFKELDEFLKKSDPRKMSYNEYLLWYARAKELQSHFSMPIIPIDMFQTAFDSKHFK